MNGGIAVFPPKQVNIKRDFNETLTLSTPFSCKVAHLYVVLSETALYMHI